MKIQDVRLRLNIRASQQAPLKKRLISNEALSLSVSVFKFTVNGGTLRVSGLPVAEIHFVEPDGIGLHISVPILLIVDGDAVPACGTMVLVMIDRGGFPIQGNRLEQQLVTGCTLHLNNDVVPTVYWIAGNASRMPMFIDVVPYVPLMAAGNPALMTPYKSLRSNELVYIEFQCL